MKKRLLSTLLILCMVLTLLPGTALATDPDYIMDFSQAAFISWGEFTAVDFSTTDTIGAGWSWDSSTKTLTLNNLSFTTSNGIGIKLPDGAALVLEGENTVASTYSDDAVPSYGINAEGALTIKGTGSLTVTGGAPTGSGHKSCGIYGAGSLTITGSAVVTATGGAAGSESCGIYSNGVTITDKAVVTATGGEANNISYGVYGYNSVTIGGGTVTATGGAATGQNGVSCGVCSNDSVTISGGTVTATGGEASVNSYGIHGGDGVTVNGGSVAATGGKAGTGSYGVYSYTSVTIQDSASVTATGGDAAVDSCGLYSRMHVTVSGGSVTATGGEAGNHSYGLHGYGRVTVSGGTVTATGGRADSSCGVYSNVSVTVNGGTVTATGGEASSYSYGVYSRMHVTVNGGAVTATGGKAGTGSYGVYSYKSVTVGDSASVIATGGASDGDSYGVYGNTSVTVQHGAALTAVGGYSAHYSYGIGGSSVTIGDSVAVSTDPKTVVVAVGGKVKDGTLSASHGIFSDSMTYNNGLLVAKGATAAMSVSALSTGDAAVTAEKDGQDNKAPNASKYYVVSPTADGNPVYHVVVGNVNHVTGKVPGHITWTIDTDPEDAGRTVSLALNNTVIIGADVTGNYSHALNFGHNLTLTGFNVVLAGNSDYGSDAAYGELNTVIGGAGSLVAVGGTDSYNSVGVRGQNITIKGSAGVTAIGGSAYSDSCGIRGTYSVSISGSAAVTAIGGSSSNSASSGVDGTIVNISGGTLTAVGGSCDNGGYGICGINSVSVSGSAAAVTAIGGSVAAGSSAGMYSQLVAVSGGALTAVGGSARTSGGSYGVCAGAFDADVSVSFKMSAGTVTAIGGSSDSANRASSDSYGVYSYAKKVDVSGGVLTAVGGSASASGDSANASSAGIYGAQAALGGRVAAIGGSASGGAVSSSYGVDVPADGSFTISGGGAAVAGSAAESSTHAMSQAPTVADGFALSGPHDGKAVAWSTATYTVTYDTDGGSEIADNNGDHSYTIFTGGFDLPTAPTKPGYTFKGWKVTVGASSVRGFELGTQYFDNANLIGLTNATGNVTLTAQWEQEYVYVPDTVYSTIEGAGGTWTRGAAKGLSFTFDAPFGRFMSLRVDGETVAPANYDKYEGSTVITLHADYLATLSVGTHTLRAIFTDGYAQTSFTIAEAVNPFADVKESDWFCDDVLYAYINGLMQGDGDAFDPHGTTTRGMLVTILYRLEKEPAATGECPFDDVESGKYYENAVTWAAANELVDGYGGGKFGPEDDITREQLAAVLWRYAKYKGYDVSVGEDTNILSYNDAFDIAEYAIPAFQWACGAGLVEGDAGNLMPQGDAERCQVAAIMHRFCENVAK